MGTTAILDRLLDPVGKSLSLKVAKAIANLRADEAAQARIDQLGDKCRDGTLTDEEKSEYDLYVQMVIWLSRAVPAICTKDRT